MDSVTVLNFVQQLLTRNGKKIPLGKQNFLSTFVKATPAGLCETKVCSAKIITFCVQKTLSELTIVAQCDLP